MHFRDRGRPLLRLNGLDRLGRVLSATLAFAVVSGCSAHAASSHATASQSSRRSLSTPSRQPVTARRDAARITRRTGMVLFSSPSRNITCWIDDDPQWDAVRCDVLSHVWTAPRSGRPKDCHGDYGSSLGIGPTKGIFICVTDAMGRPPVLPYGAGYDDGTARCISTTRGMRCVNRRTGHGFLVSRETADLF